MEAISGVFLVVLLVAFTIQARGSAASGTVGGPQPLPVPLSLAGPSPRWLRPGFLAVTIFAIGCSLRPSLGRVDICQDSASYVEFHAIRTPLYPSFIALLDRRDGTDVPQARGNITICNATSRFVSVMRAQKVVWLVSLGVLLRVLSGSIN